MTPPKGTPEYDLWVAATEVALGAPLKRNPSSASAYVPWDDVIRLRAALEAVGIDWAKYHRQAKP